MAGFVGVNPDPFTFYELVLMVEGKHKEMWQHTASIQAMIANSVRDPKKKRRAYTAEDFYPKVFLEKSKSATEARVPISALKAAFVDNPHGQSRSNTSRPSVHRTDFRQ